MVFVVVGLVGYERWFRLPSVLMFDKQGPNKINIKWFPFDRCVAYAGQQPEYGQAIPVYYSDDLKWRYVRRGHTTINNKLIQERFDVEPGCVQPPLNVRLNVHRQMLSAWVQSMWQRK